jgi:hypothetical protein
VANSHKAFVLHTIRETKGRIHYADVTVPSGVELTTATCDSRRGERRRNSKSRTHERRRLGFECGAQPLHRPLNALGKVDGGFPREFVRGFHGIQ